MTIGYPVVYLVGKVWVVPNVILRPQHRPPTSLMSRYQNPESAARAEDTQIGDVQVQNPEAALEREQPRCEHVSLRVDHTRGPNRDLDDERHQHEQAFIMQNSRTKLQIAVEYINKRKEHPFWGFVTAKLHDYGCECADCLIDIPPPHGKIRFMKRLNTYGPDNNTNRTFIADLDLVNISACNALYVTYVWKFVEEDFGGVDCALDFLKKSLKGDGTSSRPLL